MEFSKYQKKKIYFLAFIIFFNIFCLICSLLQKNSIEKLSLVPLSFLWEFFTINWCVWNSVITLIYSANEIKNEYQKISLSAAERQKDFGFVVAVSNLVSMLFFSVFYIIKTEMAAGKGWFWWTYSIAWHYLAQPMSLFYFFKFVKLKKTDLTKKNFAYLVFPMPIIFCLANLTRRYLNDPIYFEKKGLKKFLIPFFEWVEKGKLTHFTIFVLLSLLGFWLFTFLLVKIKEKHFPSTINSFNHKKNFLIFRKKK